MTDEKRLHQAKIILVLAAIYIPNSNYNSKFLIMRIMLNKITQIVENQLVMNLMSKFLH